MDPPEQTERLRGGGEPWLIEELLLHPEFAGLAATAPGRAEVLAITAALVLAGLVFPAAAMVFAAVNLARGAASRLLFGSALLSSGLSLLAGLAIAALPALRLDRDLAGDWRGFVIVFLYAWALLDFWRGARETGARPRVPAVVAGVCLAAMAGAAILVAT